MTAYRGSDYRYQSAGDDVIYGGSGDDGLQGGDGADVFYGGDGSDDVFEGRDRQQDKLYCGEGKDRYYAEKIDYVDSSCEKNANVKPPASSGLTTGIAIAAGGGPASGSPVPIPSSGGPAILLLAAALLLGSGSLTYAILRRR
jgi:Ca2+-binding RTX toxin-like protein